MPTPLSGILGGATSTAQRRETYVLTSSNASFPIPSWAQGGKGIVYVTGCGGGGGGGGRDFGGSGVGTGGAGGASGAWCLEYPITIPSGITTVAAVVGAGGAAGPDDDDDTPSNNLGGNGGTTSLTVGGFGLLLGGGSGGLSTNITTGPSAQSGSAGAFGGPGSAGSAAQGVLTAFNELRFGNGWNGTATNVSTINGPFAIVPATPAGLQGNSAGASSPFGLPGIRSITPANSLAPVGYGSGGYGGNASQPAVAGRPGFLILTFVEGL